MLNGNSGWNIMCLILTNFSSKQRLTYVDLYLPRTALKAVKMRRLSQSKVKREKKIRSNTEYMDVERKSVGSCPSLWSNVLRGIKIYIFCLNFFSLFVSTLMSFLLRSVFSYSAWIDAGFIKCCLWDSILM